MDALKVQARVDAARRIADKLIADGKTDQKGMYWDFVSQTTDLNPVWGQSENMYSGSSGVAWFLMEMKARTGEDKYLDAAVEACEWMAEYRKDRMSTNAFITGSLSVAWTFLRLADMVGESQWRDRALEIVRGVETPALEDVTIDDLLNGISGTAVALTMIHEKTGEDWILEKVEPLVEMLIRRAWMGKKGLYWDRNEKEITGLCGITHGAAGLGHAFVELGYYFKNPAFFQMTHQAFAYETDLFDAERGTWPDMRKGIFNEKDLNEHLDNVRGGDLDFFTEPKYMDAWCHGAPGIGLTRIRAYEILKDPEYLDHFRLAAKRAPGAAEGKGRSFTLCHGMFGDLEVLLEGWRVLGEDDLLDDSLVDKPIEYMETGAHFMSGFMALNPPQEGKGMFMGNAGIGYSLLRWTDPKATTTLMAPRVEAPCKGALTTPLASMTVADIFKILLEKQFGRSLRRLEAHDAAGLDQFLNGLDKCPNVGVAYMAYAEKASSGLEGVEGEKTREIVQLESELFKLDQACPSLALVNARQISHGRAWADHGETMTQEDRLVLDPEVVFKTTRWNWLGGAQEEEEETHLLIKVMPDQVLETTLNDFTYEILKSFAEPHTVAEGVEHVLGIFDLEDPSEAQQVRQLTFQQIQEALKSGMLRYAS